MVRIYKAGSSDFVKSWRSGGGKKGFRAKKESEGTGVLLIRWPDLDNTVSIVSCIFEILLTQITVDKPTLT